jgi:hypothetical protein
MPRASGCIRLFAVVALMSLGGLAQAHAANFIEKGIYLFGGPRYDGVLPPCEAALDKIASRFAQKEGQYWNSSLRILDFEQVRETAFRPWAEGTIPRRFCTAVALVNDGKKHAVKYWIGEDTGIIGMTWGVEWCVVGLDHNWAYNPRCKMAAP